MMQRLKLSIFNTKQFDFGILDDNDIHAIVLDDATLRFYPNVASLNIFEQTTEAIKDVGTRYTKCVNDVLDSNLGNFLKILNPKILFLSYGLEKAENAANKNSKFFYYGDWEDLQIDTDNIKINKQSIGTIKFTKKGKESYRDTNDYAQKSIIASIISDLQQSYSSQTPDYYKEQLIYEIKATIRNEIYKELFRPSPRMIIENRIDENRRNNF